MRQCSLGAFPLSGVPMSAACAIRRAALPSAPMAEQRNDRAAGLTGTDRPVSSDTGRIPVCCWPRFLAASCRTDVCRMRDTTALVRCLGCLDYHCVGRTGCPRRDGPAVRSCLWTATLRQSDHSLKSRKSGPARPCGSRVSGHPRRLLSGAQQPAGSAASPMR